MDNTQAKINQAAKAVREAMDTICNEAIAAIENMAPSITIKRTTERINIYTELDELMSAPDLKPGDELIISDIDSDKARYQVAHITDNHIYFVRKHLLRNEMPIMESDGVISLFDWLDSGFKDRLPNEVYLRIEGSVTLPTEKQVHGVNHYGAHEDADVFHLDIFKPTLGRVRTMENEYGEVNWWWTSTPYISNSAGFCGVGTGGTANYFDASAAFGVLPCFKLARRA